MLTVRGKFVIFHSIQLMDFYFGPTHCHFLTADLKVRGHRCVLLSNHILPPQHTALDAEFTDACLRHFSLPGESPASQRGEESLEPNGEQNVIASSLSSNFQLCNAFSWVFPCWLSCPWWPSSSSSSPSSPALVVQSPSPFSSSLFIVQFSVYSLYLCSPDKGSPPQ